MITVPVTNTDLDFIAAYNRAHKHDTWVIFTPENSQVGGVTSRFVRFENFTEEIVVLKMANDDEFTCPLSQVTINIAE